MDLGQAERDMRFLMKRYRVDDEWDFRFSSSIMMFGIAKRGWRRGVNYQELMLSRPLTEIRGRDEVQNTMLHEIAHALVGLEQSHNSTWRDRFLEMGGNGEATETDLDLVSKVANYSYRCRVDNEIVDVSQKRLSTLKWRCKEHSAKLDRWRNINGVLVLDTDIVNEV